MAANSNGLQDHSRATRAREADRAKEVEVREAGWPSFVGHCADTDTGCGIAEGQTQNGRPEQHGRMYAVGAEEAIQDTAIVIGTLPVRSTPAFVFFDFGSSTHTFITKTILDRLCRLLLEQYTPPVSVCGVSLWLSSSASFSLIS